MLKPIHKQKGFTLVELIIALSLCFFIIAIFLSFFSLSNLEQNNQAKSIDASTKLNKAVSILSTTIKRAGYWANASENIAVGININPFMSEQTNIQVNNSHNCILYSYDLNQDGILPSLGHVGSDERFGFRVIENTLQIRPVTLGSFDCDDSKDSWISLTDPEEVEVSDFNIDILTNNLVIDQQGWQVSPILQQRLVNFTLEAKLVKNDEIIFSSHKKIAVENDRFIQGQKDNQTVIP